MSTIEKPVVAKDNTSVCFKAELKARLVVAAIHQSNVKPSGSIVRSQRTENENATVAIKGTII